MYRYFFFIRKLTIYATFIMGKYDDSYKIILFTEYYEDGGHLVMEPDVNHNIILFYFFQY